MNTIKILDQLSILYKREDTIAKIKDQFETEPQKIMGDQKTVWLVIQDPNTRTYPKDWKSVGIFKNVSWIGNVDDFNNLDGQIDGTVLYICYMTARFNGSIRDEKLDLVINKLNKGKIIIVPVIPGRDTGHLVDNSYKDYKVYEIYLNSDQQSIFEDKGKYTELGKKITSIGQATKIDTPKQESTTDKTVWLVNQDPAVNWPKWQNTPIFKGVDLRYYTYDDFDKLAKVNGKILYLLYASTARIETTHLNTDNFLQVKSKLGNGKIAILVARPGNKSSSPHVASVEVRNVKYEAFTIWVALRPNAELKEAEDYSELIEWLKN